MIEILENKVVKTRKPHTCWGCGTEYPAGTEMQYLTQVDSGEWLHSYWCEVCRAVINEWHPCDKEDGVDFGMVRDGDPEFWEEIRDEITNQVVNNERD